MEINFSRGVRETRGRYAQPESQPHYATQNVPQEEANARQVGRRNEGAKLYTATAAENL